MMAMMMMMVVLMVMMMLVITVMMMLMMMVAYGDDQDGYLLGLWVARVLGGLSAQLRVSDCFNVTTPARRPLWCVSWGSLGYRPSSWAPGWLSVQPGARFRGDRASSGS